MIYFFKARQNKKKHIIADHISMVKFNVNKFPMVRWLNVPRLLVKNRPPVLFHPSVLFRRIARDQGLDQDDLT